MNRKIVSTPKDAETAGREGFCLTIPKINPKKKLASESFSTFVKQIAKGSKKA